MDGIHEYDLIDFELNCTNSFFKAPEKMLGHEYVLSMTGEN